MSEPLTSIDRNFFLLDSETSSQTIACLAITQGVPDRQVLEARVAEAVSLFPRSRLRPGARGRSGIPDRWEPDPDFRVANHVRLHEIPSVASREGLLAHASRLFSRGFEPGLPLWCFHVVTTPSLDEAVVLFLIHHAFGDGGGGMEFFHAVCEPRRRGEAARQPPLKIAAVRERPERKSGSWFTETRLWASITRAFQDMRVRRAAFPFHGATSREREIHLLTLSFERAKLMREAIGVSVNDVYLSYVAGAARMIAAKYSVPPAVRVFVPFNLRPRSARRELGNYLSAVPLSLPVDGEPVARTLKIHDATMELKDSGSFGAFGLLGTFASFLPGRFRRRLLRSACRRGNFICTNVPSSRQPLVIGGAAILESYGCAALLPEQGISIGFMSYVDSVCISLISDPALCPEPEEILDALRKAEEDLFEAIVAILPEASQVELRESLGR